MLSCRHLAVPTIEFCFIYMIFIIVRKYQIVASSWFLFLLVVHGSKNNVLLLGIRHEMLVMDMISCHFVVLIEQTTGRRLVGCRSRTITIDTKPRKKVSRVFKRYTRFVGKEYTFHHVSYGTNFSTQIAVDAGLWKYISIRLEKYTISVYTLVRIERETNTFSILFTVM